MFVPFRKSYLSYSAVGVGMYVCMYVWLLCACCRDSHVVIWLMFTQGEVLIAAAENGGLATVDRLTKGSPDLVNYKCSVRRAEEHTIFTIMHVSYNPIPLPLPHHMQSSISLPPDSLHPARQSAWRDRLLSLSYENPRVHNVRECIFERAGAYNICISLWNRLFLPQHCFLFYINHVCLFVLSMCLPMCVSLRLRCVVAPFSLLIVAGIVVGWQDRDWPCKGALVFNYWRKWKGWWDTRLPREWATTFAGQDSASNLALYYKLEA